MQMAEESAQKRTRMQFSFKYPSVYDLGTVIVYKPLLGNVVVSWCHLLARVTM